MSLSFSNMSANISRMCVFPSLAQMMWLNTNYDFVEFRLTGCQNFKIFLTEKISDSWISLVAFAASVAIFLVIRKANLIPISLKCAPEKSSFESYLARTLHRTPLSPQESRHPTPKHEHARQRDGAEWWEYGVKWDWASISSKQALYVLHPVTWACK